MKELIILEIPNGEDRGNMTAILAAAGYPCVQRIDDDPKWSYRKRYKVVVYERLADEAGGKS